METEENFIIETLPKFEVEFDWEYYDYRYRDSPKETRTDNKKFSTLKEAIRFINQSIDFKNFKVYKLTKLEMTFIERVNENETK